jgi:hypothetical protein
VSDADGRRAGFSPLSQQAAAQQSCPTKPIRFILPNAFYNSIKLSLRT